MNEYTQSMSEVDKSLFILGRKFFKLKEYTTSIEYFRKLSVHTKDSYRFLGSCYANLKQYNIANYLFNNAILKGDDISCLWLAWYFEKRSNYKKFIYQKN